MLKDSETINLVFERLFAIANASEPADYDTLSTLKKLKRQMLSAAAEEEIIRKDAKNFTLDDTVQTFDLTYSSNLSESAKWKIEELPDVKTLQPSTYLVSFLENYTKFHDRSSELACSFAVCMVICEGIAVMQGKVAGILPTQPTKDGRTPWDTVKVQCNVSFSHTIDPIPTNSKDIVVCGRVDHAVGIVMRSSETRNQLFHSLLLCIQAKFHDGLVTPLAQLVVYLACLRQSRINRGRSDASVYGVATDSLSYVFVTITHEGVLKQSRQFNVMKGDLSTVLGCLRYILTMEMSMTPYLTPEKEGLDKSDELEADADDPIDLDNNFYLHHDDEADIVL